MFFGPEGRYTRMSSSLLLVLRCEGCCWTGLKPRFTLGPCHRTRRTQLCMHAHVAAFPYLDVTKISIRPPCLNFAVYSSHMLPRRLRRLDVLLILPVHLHQTFSRLQQLLYHWKLHMSYNTVYLLSHPCADCTQHQ